MARGIRDVSCGSQGLGAARSDRLRRGLWPMVAGLVIAWGGSAAAISTVSIDVDPIRSERQRERIVRIGESFEIDVVIQEDIAEPGVAAANAFEFDLLFDATRISATSVLLGSVLAAPAIGFADEVGPGLVGFSAVSLAAEGGSRSGQLARVTLQAIGVGRATLTLAGVLVSEPLGSALATLVEDASIEVIAVPEPRVAMLMLLGLSGLAGRGRSRAVGGSRRH